MKNKSIKEKDFLELKEIVEILTDYKYNSTKEETTEQYAERIINLIRNKTIQEKDAEFNKERNKWIEERGRMAELLFKKGINKW